MYSRILEAEPLLLRKTTAGKKPQEEKRKSTHNFGGKKEERGMRKDVSARGKLAIPLEMVFPCIKYFKGSRR